MPEIFAAILPIITAIAPVASLAGTGVGLGLELSNQPGTPKSVTPSPAVTDANVAKTAQNQEASISQQFPSIQQATGGALSPDAWVQLSQLLSGQAGTPGISGTTPDLMKLLQGGGSQVTAGSTNITPQSTGLTNSTFG